ncbi:MAG: hypothetical protein NTY83_02730 [Candidatus Micrarchaeota archaeon]|nr:hypothetical protein [Candidatus Micrarchaeota archaeon]
MELERAVEEKKPSSILGLIHMGLDSYDDIFSDFDPSPYSERLLSEDFIIEAKRRYAETKKGGLELRFSLPGKLRSQKTEALIKRRLKQYFQMKVKDSEDEIGRSRARGAMYFGAGFVVLLTVAFVPGVEALEGVAHFIEILLVPIGWFGMFDGVELLIESPRKFEKEINFNRKLSEASYTFFSEEELVRTLEEGEAGKKGWSPHKARFIDAAEMAASQKEWKEMPLESIVKKIRTEREGKK